MNKIMFVCHGNICRSTMAEFVMKDLVKKQGLENEFIIASSGTSSEELGNSVHPGTANLLSRYGISTKGKYAVQLKASDYENFDYFIGMDSRNIQNMNRIFPYDKEHKIHTLLSYANSSRDIADPWYTGDFETTYRDVLEGCTALLNTIINK